MVQPDYEKLAQISNLGRNGPDMFDSWDSVMDVVNLYGKNDGHFAEVAGPGYFNDPDEVLYLQVSFLPQTAAGTVIIKTCQRCTKVDYIKLTTCTRLVI